MKRKEAPSKEAPSSKKAKSEVPEYHLTPSSTEEDGSIQWPAPRAKMERASEIIVEWYVVSRLAGRILTDRHLAPNQARRL